MSRGADSNRAQETANTIIANYMVIGKDISAKECAKIMGCSESRVRAALREIERRPDAYGIQLKQRRETRRNHYGAYYVWVYGPTREALRDLALQWKEQRSPLVEQSNR